MRFSPLRRRFSEFVRAARARLPAFGVRRRTMRLLRIGAAFGLTIGFLGFVGVVAMAALSRTALIAPASLLEAEPGRSAALQAVERIYALPDAAETRMDDTRLFAPAARAERAAQVKDGAIGAARQALLLVRVARGERHAEWAEARRLAAAPDSVARAQVGAAVSRLNSAAARGDIVLRAEPEDVRAAALAAAADCEAIAASFGDIVAAAQAGPASAAQARRFHEARGAAYGWALIVQGAGMDGGRAAPLRGVSLLQEAASLQPLFLGNAPADAALSANHFVHLAFALERAADALRAEAR